MKTETLKDFEDNNREMQGWKKLSLECKRQPGIEVAFYNPLSLDAKGMIEWGIEVKNGVWKKAGKEFDINDAVLFCITKYGKVKFKGVGTKEGAYNLAETPEEVRSLASACIFNHKENIL